MRHSLVLSGEQADSFMQVLAHYEKIGVVRSIEDWQIVRTARNLAAHDYETDYGKVADHFNALHELLDTLYQTARRFIDFALAELGVEPLSRDFSAEFDVITAATRAGR
jgi:hypothetical protein